MSGKKRPKRARLDDGTYKADDPSTPNVNEAWEEAPPKIEASVKVKPKSASRIVFLGGKRYDANNISPMKLRRLKQEWGASRLKSSGLII